MSRPGTLHRTQQNLATTARDTPPRRELGAPQEDDSAAARALEMDVHFKESLE